MQGKQLDNVLKVNGHKDFQVQKLTKETKLPEHKDEEIRRKLVNEEVTWLVVTTV